MQVEWGQLLLEQSAWASHSRVESMVTQQLSMSVHSAKKSFGAPAMNAMEYPWRMRWVWLILLVAAVGCGLAPSAP